MIVILISFQTSDQMRKILVEQNTTVLADTIYGTDPQAQLQQIQVRHQNATVVIKMKVLSVKHLYQSSFRFCLAGACFDVNGNDIIH